MRNWIDIVTEAKTSTSKIPRSAFIYLTPKPNTPQFAQCGTCGVFIPNKNQCALFGKKDHVVAGGSCGLYAYGEPSNDQEPSNSVTPKEAGYVDAQVRCENCSWLDGTTCELFKRLNSEMPTVFKLETKVDARGCCNAWQQK
jgi:hypothetical protein